MLGPNPILQALAGFSHPGAAELGLKGFRTRVSWFLAPFSFNAEESRMETIIHSYDMKF